MSRAAAFHACLGGLVRTLDEADDVTRPSNVAGDGYQRGRIGGRGQRGIASLSGREYLRRSAGPPRRTSAAAVAVGHGVTPEQVKAYAAEF